MKSLVVLLESLLLDSGRKSGAPVSKDIRTLWHRVEHEGDSFITITLPNFCKDFERSLAEGQIPTSAFLSFKKIRTGIPAFLQGFLRKVFDADGRLLDEPCVDCIRSVRQICLFGKKVHRACSASRLTSASTEFVKCDQEVVTELSGRLFEIYGEVCDLLVRELHVKDIDEWEEDFLPRHGPGATREHISGNQKWDFQRWHMRLEMAGIKYWRYGKATSYPSYTSTNPLPAFTAPWDEEPVRVVFVPKTLKTPRVIAVEPVCMQYVQQGLSKLIVRRIEKSRTMRGHVNFTDQSINQELVRQASAHGMLASLDMSEASDRVSTVHVERLLETCPRLRDWVFACRSSRAELPNGDIITLKKFASMGSALCFPMEAMVFFASIIASMVSRLGLPVTTRLVHSLAEDVYVYGDDLIVPADMAPLVCDDLEALGFKVNRHKSFWTGQFRESCGSDCYDSEDVTPVYFRRDLPTDREDVSGLLSSVATVNQLSKLGYHRTAGLMRNQVERVFGKLPNTTPDSPAIGWHDYSEVKPPTRWNRMLQRREFSVLVAVPRWVQDSLRGSEQALAKCFRVIGLDKIDPKHLLRSVRPYALALKRRWVPTL